MSEALEILDEMLKIADPDSAEVIRSLMKEVAK